ncbi:YfiR family protein [Saccharicrinis aurantiacus]|uniref:YfiR family protein n=1 Tax=Saccharicrinis aurantiacus TaxID=1849719 RepID=UPI00094FE1C5|nr:YfiR family protein [Saccharicrinis aurantiacus]
MKKKILVLIMAIMSLSATGQQSMFKALFLFNFAKYIEWPQSSNQKDFIIGIYGSDDVEDELKKLASSRKINAKTIIIKKVGSPDEAKGANILYIPTSKSNSIDEITKSLLNEPTLIVTDKAKMCNKGAHINYALVDGKMKFEISKNNINSNNLKVSPKLISLGIEVQ